MKIPPQQIKDFLKNKKILVTGGTGSIGREMVSELLKYDPAKVVVFSKDDSKQYLMQQNYADQGNLSFCLGDIRDDNRVEFVTRGMDLIFHTAALKQVPICETNPFEAAMTNIIGSENLIRASIQNKVGKVINISSDKAVNPINIMGATKFIAEKQFKQANILLNNGYTKFCSVRFGNVIGSRGSVIPLFMNQAKSGRPLTITDPNMTRFFMTISEAVSLTLKAAYYSQGGETFILKMEALRINELVEAVQEYCRRLGSPVPLTKLIGVRAGDKLYEELMTADEVDKAFEDDELYVIRECVDHTSFLHFQPTKLKAYRSDQVNAITKEKMVHLLHQLFQ
ncbi:SDR family NAD(P)-dependent oxidoreductase [Brevibacillus sp. NRS-1366]|uniref:SDR family NAD(P)-dependent oxidoreductase n=1 Tax=Brevibacillus sp. NRS-1366 TaxID=3233899 RepID=UPI003D1D3F10